MILFKNEAHKRTKNFKFLNGLLEYTEVYIQDVVAY